MIDVQRTRTTRTWSFPSNFLGGQILYALGIWGAFVVVILGVTLGIAYFDSVNSSIWDASATQVVRWYPFVIGIYLSGTTLPLLITHGKTRRDSAIEGVIFSILFTAAIAVLATIGYVLEAVLYRIAGWPQEIGDNHWFTSANQLPIIFAEYWVVLFIWILGGAFIGAAFYRKSDTGWLSIPLALIPAALTDFATFRSWEPITLFLGSRLGTAITSVPQPLLSSILILASILFFLVLTWRLIRDIPLQTK